MFPVCTYGGIVWYAGDLDVCVSLVSCTVKMSGCDFLYDAVYVDL